ncbi:MAG: hypothetical protein HN952_07575 [Candidatus Cloacimonetes bacterium]|jgi:hypothetical protein|nr:hypothetical protein [Candidatus Cloacimonadota bacterium]MBT6994793.1 hypothetical protein [Candidatus Cloacimonadota bacterium]MBT7469200.1 hypothetical protein [Candidatus Cloacimonadota bacterium]
MKIKTVLIVVLIAVIFGTVFHFKNKAKIQHQQNIIGDLEKIAADALTFYKKPTIYGGGEKSWTTNIDNFGKFCDFEYNEKTDCFSIKKRIYSLKREDDTLFISAENSTTLKIIGTTSEIISSQNE